MADVFFNSKKLPTIKREYVAFIDIMGTKSHMKNSVKSTANYIFKLHAAILTAWRNEKYQNVFVYPVMDGAYITATNKEDIEKILIRIYLELSKVLTKENNPFHRFIVRGAVAYGETIHGHHVPYDASKVFETDLSYKNNILLGAAMIKAYEGEGYAAPFGIYVDETAQKHTDDKGRKYGSFTTDWKWYESKTIKIDTRLITDLKVTIDDYFEKLKDEKHPCHYSLEKIESHHNLANTYFGKQTVVRPN